MISRVGNFAVTMGACSPGVTERWTSIDYPWRLLVILFKQRFVHSNSIYLDYTICSNAFTLLWIIRKLIITFL